MNLILLAGLLAIGTMVASAQTTRWGIDKAHSSVGFSATHFLISEVTGDFGDFMIEVVSDKEDFTDAKISASINVASINTREPKRDGHLKSDDFFNAEKFPTISFVGTKMEKTTGNNYKLTGNLTMRDTTRTVTWDARFKGSLKDPWGNKRCAFRISGSVNRFDYGLKWSQILEQGGLIVGEDVDFVVNIELVQQK